MPADPTDDLLGRVRDRAATTRAELRAGLERRGRRALDRTPHPVQQGWRLAERTWRDTVDDRVPGLAAEAALFTMISLPALLLVVLGALGFVADALGPEGAEELDRIVFELPRAALSDSTYDYYARIATQVLADGRADVVGVGLLLSLWTGSRAMNRYLATIVIAYDVDASRPGWRRRVLALALTVGALVGAVAVLPLLVLGPRLVRSLLRDDVATMVLQVASWFYWPTLGVLLLVALTTLYHLGVPWRTPWRRDLPGAVLAMLLWFAAAAALRAYLALAVSDDAVYEQLGTPIAVVLWLYVSALAVLLGAELNAEIEKSWPTGPGATDPGATDPGADVSGTGRPGPH